MNQHQRKSLGHLKMNPNKVKPRSPALIGNIKLQRHHMAVFMREFEDAADDYCIANIAAWNTTDDEGNPYLTVELQPKWNGPRNIKCDRTVFDLLPADE